MTQDEGAMQTAICRHTDWSKSVTLGKYHAKNRQFRVIFLDFKTGLAKCFLLGIKIFYNRQYWGKVMIVYHNI